MDNKRNCSFNDSYEKAKKKIEEETKNMKFFYIQGPTGPKGDPGIQGAMGLKGEKGDPGPTTINIGKIETVNPEEEAEVINVGTSQDVILDFKIPRGIEGLKGEKGDIGPRGLPGEIGISQAITIDATETIEPDEEAIVHDDFESNIHHLTFYIPKGEKGDPGPIGPQGPAARTSAYAIRYLISARELQLSGQQDVLVPLNETGESNNATYIDDYAIQINETGCYLISYFLSASPSEQASITPTVKSNDIVVTAANACADWIGDSTGNISNTIITSLTEGDKITLNVRADEEITLTFGDRTSAVLTITKID